MNKTIKGYICGFLSAAILVGGTYAKSRFETIEVMYNNIKVYKDNVLCELKDSNGTVIEPFIYNGTTYMPVRGTASLADMQVTWDGNTQSVYLWDTLSPAGTSFMEVCPPYDKSSGCFTYLSTSGKSFSMAGEKYSDGLTFSSSSSSSFALFNLNSKFSTIECIIGHTDYEQEDKSVSFIVDGRIVKEIALEAECLPKTVSIPVNYGLQLKIITNSSRAIGIGSMTIK